MRQTLDERLEELYDKGFDRYKVERATESAAMMAAPVFQSLGLEYGDRVPGMYRLAETIQELAISVIHQHKELDMEYPRSETGRFVVEIEEASPDEKFLRVYLDLGQFDLKDLAE